MLKRIFSFKPKKQFLRFYSQDKGADKHIDKEDEEIVPKKIKVKGSVNRAIICGYVGANPKTFTTKNGSSVTRFFVATTETFKMKSKKIDNTTWHQIVIFNGQVGDNVQKNLKKGMFVYVEGIMHHHKKDGNYNFQILCNHPANLKILNGEIEKEDKEEEEK